MLPHTNTTRIVSLLVALVVVSASLTAVGGVAAAPAPGDGPIVDGDTDVPTPDEESDVPATSEDADASTDDRNADASTTSENTDTTTSEGDTERTTSTTPHDSCGVDTNPPGAGCSGIGPIWYVGTCHTKGFEVSTGFCLIYYDGTRAAGAGIVVGLVDDNHGSHVAAGTSTECGGDSSNEVGTSAAIYVAPNDQQTWRDHNVDNPSELISECTP